MSVTIEGETGDAQVIRWPQVFQRSRPQLGGHGEVHVLPAAGDPGLEGRRGQGMERICFFMSSALSGYVQSNPRPRVSKRTFKAGPGRIVIRRAGDAGVHQHVGVYEHGGWTLSS